MSKPSAEKARLSIAGEYGVASELCKRGYDASLTFGNAKAVDIIITDLNNCNLYKTIEVKTTRSNRFVTGFFQKYGDQNTKHPDYWVLVHIDKDNISHYYILTHQEMGLVQMQRNGMTAWGPIANGCDNVLLSHIQQYEDQWEKIAL